MTVTKAAPLIDLNAAKRESSFPDGIPVVLGDAEFLLPAELPVDVLDPILDLDLASLFKQVIDALDDGDGEDGQEIGQVIVDVLLARPALPKELVGAIKSIVATLFGASYEEFLDEQPSINDYVRLVQGLLPLYGVGLGNAFGSAEPSESDGETSKPTSSSTTDLTPAVSGGTRKKRGSSASGG